MATLSSSQCSGSSAGASAAGRDCQPYSSNDFESFDSKSEISSSRAPGLLVVGGELWRSATLEWRPMPTIVGTSLTLHKLKVWMTIVEWVECMGVASGCGEQEVGVASKSRWNLWVWLLGVVCKEVYRFPHTTYPYSSCICTFLQQHPYFFVHLKKKVFRSCSSTFLKLHFRY